MLNLSLYFSHTKTKKNQEAKIADWDAKRLWSRKVANIWLKEQIFPGINSRRRKQHMNPFFVYAVQSLQKHT